MGACFVSVRTRNPLLPYLGVSITVPSSIVAKCGLYMSTKAEKAEQPIAVLPRGAKTTCVGNGRRAQYLLWMGNVVQHVALQWAIIWQCWVVKLPDVFHADF